MPHRATARTTWTSLMFLKFITRVLRNQSIIKIYDVPWWLGLGSLRLLRNLHCYHFQLVGRIRSVGWHGTLEWCDRQPYPAVCLACLWVINGRSYLVVDKVFNLNNVAPPRYRSQARRRSRRQRPQFVMVWNKPCCVPIRFCSTRSALLLLLRKQTTNLRVN